MQTRLFGILNVTPDSCYDGGKYWSFDQAIERGLQIQEEGADFIDVGGESTQPNAEPIAEEEELRRVIPIIKELKKQVQIPISIDTHKAKVAEEALKAGASFINDISGLSDLQMIHVVKDYNVPVCVMHMQGTPKTMQKNPYYPQGLMVELKDWFQKKIDSLLAIGIRKEQVILDPGIGFGKTVEHNFEILQNLAQFKALGFPIFLGLSRKSFMMRYLGKTRDELLPASLAVASYAIWHQIDFLRVHDVENHRDAIRILTNLK